MSSNRAAHFPGSAPEASDNGYSAVVFITTSHAPDVPSNDTFCTATTSSGPTGGVDDDATLLRLRRRRGGAGMNVSRSSIVSPRNIADRGRRLPEHMTTRQ